jgi:uncharacterized protein (UPF0333 family)
MKITLLLLLLLLLTIIIIIGHYYKLGTFNCYKEKVAHKDIRERR